MKWAVQWSLRIPPSATPIVPTGMAAVLVCRTKILFFVSVFLLLAMPEPDPVLNCCYALYVSSLKVFNSLGMQQKPRVFGDMSCVVIMVIVIIMLSALPYMGEM